MAGLLDNPQAMTLLFSGLGGLTAKTKDRANYWQDYAANGLLNQAYGKKKRERDQPMNDLNMQYKQAQIDALGQPKKRDMKEVDGQWRYIDDGSLVFPDAPTTPMTPFDNVKDELSAKQGTRSKLDSANKITNKVRNTFSRATDVINERGNLNNLTGADDTLMMKSLANMILPSESVMGDDLQTIQNQSGLPAYFTNFAAKLSGGGTLAPQERATIYQTMKSLHNTAVRDYEKEKVRFWPDIQSGGWGQDEFFQEHAVPYDIPQGLLNMPTPKPITKPKADPIKANSILDKWFN